MMVARPLLLLAAYLILVCDICGETLLPLDAEGGVGSNALGLREPPWAAGAGGFIRVARVRLTPSLGIRTRPRRSPRNGMSLPDATSF